MSQEFSLQVASVVVEKSGRFLLVQEGSEKAYGMWNLPGGHADPGETLPQAAAREAFEESGYTVKVGKEILVLDRPKDDRQLHAFKAEVLTGSPTPQDDEILSVDWFTLDEIKAMENKLRSPDYVFKAIERYEQS